MMRINLLRVRTPKAVRLVQNQFLVFLAAFLAASAAAVWWSLAVYAAKSSAEDALAAEKAKLARLESVTQKVEEIEAKKKRREEILDAIRRLEERKQGPRPYLDRLNTLLPTDLWLTDVNAAGVGIVVSGYSFSNNAIADLMRGMEASDQFQDVELGIIQNEVSQKENVKRFTLNGRLKTLARLDDIAKKKEAEAKAAAAKPAEAPKPAAGAK
ncbi:MAG: PilN domain-containing protein [Nitrospinae bacterium]|nr:PilN domain-containing protein [Nitrospinota bacterium]